MQAPTTNTSRPKAPDPRGESKGPPDVKASALAGRVQTDDAPLAMAGQASPGPAAGEGPPHIEDRQLAAAQGAAPRTTCCSNPAATLAAAPPVMFWGGLGVAAGAAVGFPFGLSLPLAAVGGSAGALIGWRAGATVDHAYQALASGLIEYDTIEADREMMQWPYRPLDARQVEHQLTTLFRTGLCDWKTGHPERQVQAWRDRTTHQSVWSHDLWRSTQAGGEPARAALAVAEGLIDASHEPGATFWPAVALVVLNVHVETLGKHAFFTRAELTKLAHGLAVALRQNSFTGHLLEGFNDSSDVEVLCEALQGSDRPVQQRMAAALRILCANTVRYEAFLGSEMADCQDCEGLDIQMLIEYRESRAKLNRPWYEVAEPAQEQALVFEGAAAAAAAVTWHMQERANRGPQRRPQPRVETSAEATRRAVIADRKEQQASAVAPVPRRDGVAASGPSSHHDASRNKRLPREVQALFLKLGSKGKGRKYRHIEAVRWRQAQDRKNAGSAGDPTSVRIVQRLPQA
ncbi:hypothetical protein [Ramlibacter albus]|uniref:Uncharacterized protein n=1 Tax=Ramlibacter albus TaxID=2079448 RepID=A0A923S1L2_9BURK|nr:hypothetical protein [Ramlibacter albus]MBC5764405.1 hypothetical protein [Ramlibacter albus]